CESLFPQRNIHSDQLPWELGVMTLTYFSCRRAADIYSSQLSKKRRVMSTKQLWMSWVIKILVWYRFWATYHHQDNNHTIFPWSPNRTETTPLQTNFHWKQALIVSPTNPTQTEPVYLIGNYTCGTSLETGTDLGFENDYRPWLETTMADARTEELVIKLEEALGFSSLESGTKLIGVPPLLKRFQIGVLSRTSCRQPG
ncbi:unnamed protein product, partial [Prunus brigantina]